MRSEKGITLVALIGVFVLIVILAGISISIAAKGNNEEQAPINNVTTTDGEIEDYEEEELVVDPFVSTNANDVEEDVDNKTVEDQTVVSNTVENVVEDATNTTVENEVE